MIGYKPTSMRRYMWGSGVVMSLVLCTMAFLWAHRGRFDLRVSVEGREKIVTIGTEKSPTAFWGIVGIFGLSGFSALVATYRGLRRVQREEAQKNA